VNNCTYDCPRLLWLILALAFALRLLGAWNGNLMYDEATHLACAQTIDLRPDHFNLVSRSVDHPPLSVYLVRLSEYLFGDSNFGIRILHALAGALTVLPVFLLAARTFSVSAGLWAAGLLALDRFHMSWSDFIVPEVLLLLFTPLVLLRFQQATETRAARDFAIAGLYLGLAYLAKETALFIAPALWLSLWFGRAQRRLLLDYRSYLTYLVAALVAGPDIVNNLVHFYEGYFYRDAGMVHSSWHPSLRVAILYLGDLVQGFTATHGGFDGTGLQNPVNIYWPAGLLYLAALVAALRQAHNPRVRLLLVSFGFSAFAFTVLPAHGYDGMYWWPSISVIPAVVCAGALLAHLQQWSQAQPASLRRLGSGALLAGGLWLGAHAVQTGLRDGLGVPRKHAATLVDGAVTRARAAQTDAELLKLDFLLPHTLHIAGPHAALYSQLARLALAQQHPDKAGYFVRRSLALDPHDAVAQQLAAQLRLTAP
jgi:4-amino-4-deoxy-L-arabinose transferase-like glycosyltransferase